MLISGGDRPLSQGDIVVDVPFFIIPKAITVELHGVKARQQCSPSDVESFRNLKAKSLAEKKGIVAVEMPLEVEPGIIVTHDCDLDNREVIAVAKLFPMASYAVNLKDALELEEPLVVFDFKRRVTEGSEFGNLIYVGKAVDDTLLCGDLHRVYTFPKKGWYEYFRANRVKSLDDNGKKYLQGRLAAFAGRYATDTGFWHTDEDKAHAEAVSKDKGLIQKAYENLKAKKSSASNPPSS
ncbi:MAG: hypothetical protein U0791_25955 [Gemmataceae bacterium]